MKIVLPPERPRYEMAVSGDVTVTLSPLSKEDRELIRRGLTELSVESRFARFGVGLSRLNERELDYLSDVDQHSHVAWGAAIGEEVAGVGRYIVSDDESCAEVAITVLDAMQRKGVGQALAQALIAVARADGVEELCVEVLAENEAVLGLIEEVELIPNLGEASLERRIRVSAIPVRPDEEGLLATMNRARQEADSSSRSSDTEFTQ